MSLTKEFLKKQRESLITEKERLETQIKTLKKYPDYGDLDEDNEQELVDYETNMSAEDNLVQVLKKVNMAIKAIDDGNYGRCQKCGEMIDKERLEIMPFAAICVSCKNKTK